MATRNAAPGASDPAKAKIRARPWPGDARTLNDALAALEAHRRDTLLEAVAEAARELLRAPEMGPSLQKVIERIGAAAGVDRAHLFLIDNTAHDGRIVEHHLWTPPDIQTPADFQNITRPMADAGLRSWLPRLERGETIVGHVRDFTPEARALLELGSIKSTLCVPVFADDRWAGAIAFDDCRSERDWLQAEIDTIKTLAELVGAALVRTAHLKELADANRIIENSSTILYRIEPRPPFPLIFISKNVKRYGYDLDDLLVSPTIWQQRIHREDLPVIIANLKSIMERKTDIIRAEFRFKKSDGSWVWFEDTGRALRDASGRLVAIEGILSDITERKEAAHRRDAILKAVAASAGELLRSSDLQQSLPKVIAWIGQAIGVDRAHIFEVDTSSPANRVLQHYMWIAPSIPTSPLLMAVKGAALSEFGIGPWLPRLAKGEIIVGNVQDFEPPVRELFNRLRTQSVLSVPVIVDGHWWGHLGFDDCRNGRKWSPTEIDTLKTLAELVGAGVARMAHLKTLADANRIVENSPTILYRLSAQRPYSLIYLSQNVRQYGLDADRLLASRDAWLHLFDPEYHPAILADIKALVEGKAQQTLIELRMNKPDGTHEWFEARGYAVRDADRRLTAIEGILVNITERKIAAEKIAALARTDALTGLPNRTAFLDRLRLEVARARRGDNHFAVHYIDLDHFKDVNDTLGHPVGDLLLREVAERLKGCVRETDMVARFGGDEFAVLQDDVADDADVETLAAKASRTISEPYGIGSYRIMTSASIGLVPYRSDIGGPDAMMMKADLALYRAKREGRGQYRFHVAKIDEQTRERMVIGEDLRHAVARNEFELYYQPQVELESGLIVGLEALIRWNHPKRGLMLPTTFIPIAETTGSIVPIGEWVIEQACCQIRAWADRNIAPPVVAVNMSGAQFKLASQIDRIVTRNLARYQLLPRQLELELTESVLLETTQRHGKLFKRLRKIGVRLAIDDFGTGYSSLDYLRSFRVSRLKIDRSFIADVATNPDDAAIVRATIGLANELGMEVLAEGVETATQRDFLVSAGCKLAQGYLFGRPQTAATVTELLKRNLPTTAT